MLAPSDIAILVSVMLNILLAGALLQERRHVRTDRLTGLRNKLGLLLELRLKELYRRMWPLDRRTHAAGGAVLYIDLDNFKPVNDRYGHHVGDLLIVEFSKFLKNQVRTGDTLARLHGDEFVVVLEDADHAQAERIARLITRNLEKHVFSVSGHDIKLEATIGVAAAPVSAGGAESNIDLDHLIREADRAMLASKQRQKES